MSSRALLTLVYEERRQGVCKQCNGCDPPLRWHQTRNHQVPILPLIHQCVLLLCWRAHSAAKRCTRTPACYHLQDKRELLEDAVNRWCFNDEDMPDWFEQDQRRANFRHLIVSKVLWRPRPPSPPGCFLPHT